MTPKVTEILGRSEQGVIRPYICRCDDGCEYFIKGSVAGRQALVSEWIAGNLALQLKLPVPHISLVQVSQPLIAYGAREDLADLGAGTWFGSRSVRDVIEFPFSAIERVDPLQRARVLLFDWWVLNKDRNFGPDGGNPNLLWEPWPELMHVIDHNLAFESAAAAVFWEHHVFQADRALWTKSFRTDMEPLMKNAIDQVQSFWNEMPEEWYEDLTGFGIDEVLAVLKRYENDDFWRNA